MRTLAFWTVSLLFLSLCARAGEETPSADEPAQKTPGQAFLESTVYVKHIDSNKGLEKLITLPQREGNAATHYAKLETLYPQDRKNEDPKDPSVRYNGQGIREILAAVRLRECRLTPDYYPRMSQGTAKQPDFIVFETYAAALLDLAEEYENRGEVEKADAVYHSAFIYGWHMTQDRSSLIAYLIGLDVKLNAAKKYSSFLQRRMKMQASGAALEYYQYLLRLQRAVYRKARVQLGDFRRFNCLYALIRVAEKDTEAFWRQEAVLRLGVLRHGAPSAARDAIDNDEYFQQVAEDALTKVAETDPAPWVRQLALWTVKNVDHERFAQLRQGTSVMPEEEQP